MPTLFPADSVSIQTTDYSTRLTFSLTGSPEPLCVVVLAHPVAKQVAMILRNQLLRVETVTGAEIRILPAAYQQMGISPEDWPQWKGPVS